MSSAPDFPYYNGQPVEISLQYLDGDQRKIEVAGLSAEAAQ